MNQNIQLFCIFESHFKLNNNVRLNIFVTNRNIYIYIYIYIVKQLIIKLQFSTRCKHKKLKNCIYNIFYLIIQTDFFIIVIIIP